jgi:integrase
VSTAGSIKKQPNGTWTVVVDVPATNGSKRQQLRRRGFATKGEAQAELTTILSTVQEGTFVKPSKLTFGQYLSTRWIPAMRPTVRKTTGAAYAQMAKHLERHLGAVPLGELSGPQLTIVYCKLLDAGLSERTVRYVHTTAHRALRDAVRWHLVPRNVADDADAPRQPTAQPKAWTPAQVATFLKVATDDRWAALWRLAATTGLRRGELAGLRWDDLDLARGSLTVNRATVVAAGKAVESEPKTARGRRRMALDPHTVEQLKAWRKRQREEHFAMGEGWQGDGRVFVWPDGTALHPNVITRSFGRLVKQAKLPALTLHGLRHSWATSALVAGVPVKVVSDRLGHSSARITLDVYTASVPSLDAEAADLVAGLFVSRDQSVTSRPG